MAMSIFFFIFTHGHEHIARHTQIHVWPWAFFTYGQIKARCDVKTKEADARSDCCLAGEVEGQEDIGIGRSWDLWSLSLTCCENLTWPSPSQKQMSYQLWTQHQSGQWGFIKYRPPKKQNKYRPNYLKYRPHSTISTKYRPQKFLKKARIYTILVP